jgi:hypothetical protein
MPKLYYTPTSCGMANFISAVAAGVKIDCEQVNLATHRTAVGDVDFYTINPKGNVPTIVLDDGTVLNENAATLQYIADQVSFERYSAILHRIFDYISPILNRILALLPQKLVVWIDTSFKMH